jgi:3-dehydroquinate synthase/2-deoxy-scyllo-inosose synthase
MQNLQLQFEDEHYPVWIGVRCLDEIISRLRELGASSYHMITDRTVSQLHADVLYEELTAQTASSLWVVDNGESFKSLKTVEHFAQEMVRAGIDRSSVIVAVGGGLIGNLGGLIAALLFRGIRLVHVPTTLIAAADSVASLKQATYL